MKPGSRHHSAAEPQPRGVPGESRKEAQKSRLVLASSELFCGQKPAAGDDSTGRLYKASDVEPTLRSRGSLLFNFSGLKIHAAKHVKDGIAEFKSTRHVLPFWVFRRVFRGRQNQPCSLN
jgi:hypothetical protein